MSGDYLWDRSGPRVPEVVRLERVLGTLRQREPLRPLTISNAPRRRAPAVSFLVVLSAAAAVTIALVGGTWIHRFDATPGWEVTRVSGAPVVASRPVQDRAQLKVGGWLETNADARATIAVGTIGQVAVEPHTRLGRLSARPGDYRLHLVRGTMHALIWSPPGQFFVETPSSTAIDLGCAYTMTVDDEGVGVVRVTSGWVGFEWRGREAFIPAGAMCITRPGLGPGTPHFENTPPAFRAALAMLDLRSGSASERDAALGRVLAEARERDSVTLWHLLTRVDPDQRGRVFDRLAELVPPPAGVTRDGVREGRREMLDRWWDDLGLGTSAWWRTWKQQWRDVPGQR